RSRIFRRNDYLLSTGFRHSDDLRFHRNVESVKYGAQVSCIFVALKLHGSLKDFLIEGRYHVVCHSCVMNRGIVGRAFENSVEFLVETTNYGTSPQQGDRDTSVAMHLRIDSRGGPERTSALTDSIFAQNQTTAGGPPFKMTCRENARVNLEAILPMQWAS